MVDSNDDSLAAQSTISNKERPFGMTFSDCVVGTRNISANARGPYA